MFDIELMMAELMEMARHPSSIGGTVCFLSTEKLGERRSPGPPSTHSQSRYIFLYHVLLGWIIYSIWFIYIYIAHLLHPSFKTYELFLKVMFDFVRLGYTNPGGIWSQILVGTSLPCLPRKAWSLKLKWTRGEWINSAMSWNLSTKIGWEISRLQSIIRCRRKLSQLGKVHVLWFSVFHLFWGGQMYINVQVTSQSCRQAYIWN